MRIGELAGLCGVPPKTIRYYESIGLLPAANRTTSGYRNYDAQDVRVLRFIHRARGLGFSTDTVRGLLGLWQDRDRASADVRAVASRQIETVTRKIKELETIKQALEHLIDGCHGDERPDCPIIDRLAGEDVDPEQLAPNGES